MATRITGLSSGMDVDSLVKSMMKPDQTRIDKVSQKKTKSQWVQQAYNDVNASLAKFILDRKSDFGLTTNAVTGTIMNASISSLTWLKTVNMDNSDVAGATAGASAVDGSFKINVKTLAQSWSAASQQSLPELADEASDTLASRFSLDENSNIDFTITTNKGTIRITTDKDAVAEAGIALLKLDINGNSVMDVASMINSAGVGLKASFDNTSRRFFLQTASSGASSTLKISDNSTGLGTGLDGFIAGSSSLLKLYAEKEDGLEQVQKDMQYKGIDAVVDIGAAKDITQSTNVFSINGVSLSLKKTGAANIQVSTDVNSAYDKIKKFVDEYNKLIDSLNTKLSEKYDRDYPPLTDEQKSSMSEDQIKTWETKAKTGLLSNDTEITEMFYSMRTGISSKVEGLDAKYATLSNIGITTEAYSNTSAGRLVIDEGKLKEALQNDAASVVNLLFKSPDSKVTDTSEQKKQSGVINQLFGNIINGMKSIVNKAGVGNNASLYRSVQSNMLIDFVTTYGATSSIDKEITAYQTSISDLNKKYTDIQTRYYNKFIAMEQAISKANSQSAWLSQQLGSSTG
jgi:flagellar hook-associated protein 2